MAHAWKACWVNALGGSNPPSSAPRQAPDLRKQVRGLFRSSLGDHAGITNRPPTANQGVVSVAQIAPRKRTDGGITYQVRWRDGGTRDGDWQSESFTAEARARAFKLDVEESGHRWPDGWTKGEGYIATSPRPDVLTFADVRDAYWVAQ